MNIIKRIFKKLKEGSANVIADSNERKNHLIENGNLQTIYLLGWEVKLNGDRRCYDFLKTQRTSKTNTKKFYPSLELLFKDNKLVRAYELDEGERQEKNLEDEEIGLEYEDFPINPILKFEDDQNGIHQLGGKKPNDVAFPENNCKVPFQYLGFISNQDENLKWLPTKIHLMCPIFLNIDKVYLDHSNPKQPVLINRNELEQVMTEYDELNENSIIEYKERKFNFIPSDEIDLPMSGGVPSWIQYPDIPHCPKSGKTMKFLCQITDGVDTLNSNVIPKNEFCKRYFDTLNFWCDGEIFIFVEPEEKTVCYLIQNT